MENKKKKNRQTIGGKRGAKEMDTHVDQMQDKEKLNESED